MSDNVQLSEVVANIAKRFELVDNKPLMSEAAFAESTKTLALLPEAERKQTSVELLALAIKFRNLGGDAVEQALGQIYLLCAQVLGDYLKAEQLFASQNVDLSKASKFIDNQVQQRPVGTTPLTQGNNLFALLKSKKD